MIFGQMIPVIHSKLNEGRQFTLDELLMIATFIGPKEIPTETVEGKNKLVDKIRKLIEKESK